jgi:hypothetical protein
MRKLALLAGTLLMAGACGDNGAETTPDAPPAEPDAPPTTPPFMIDVFASAGHVFRLDVSKEQADIMEQGEFQNDSGDEYSIGGDVSFADNLTVTDAKTGMSQSFGKVELAIVGQSTRRPWKRIPSLRLDVDEFTMGQKVGDQEYMRLNNGQVSGAYREAVAVSMWKHLGYHAPRATFAWVEAPGQWGSTVRVPYTLLEVYKRKWCDANFAPDNTCVNIWESYGDIQDLAKRCQVAECDDTRLLEFANLLQNTAPGPGYEQATSAYMDWDAFRSFQCISWITGTGDDYIHNNNNLVLVERSDGKMQFLPYSTDISAGQQWYPDVQLLGGSQLARGCQLDPTCWTKLLNRCDQLLTKYETSNVVEAVVEPMIKSLNDAGMQRRGDDRRAQELRDWYGSRASKLRSDTIWQATPCETQEACANHPDGLTSCQGVCVAPDGDGTCGGRICNRGEFCVDDVCLRPIR